MVNTEAGGRFLHEPTTVDEKQFALLSTLVVPQLESSVATRPASLKEQSQIEALAKEIQVYANANPAKTGTSQYLFFTHQLDSLVRGLMFSVLQNGFTPFLTLGSKITQGVFLDPKGESFFLGSSRSAHLATTAFNFFGLWEKNLSALESSLTARMAASNHLPFINLFNWPKADPATLNDALLFVKRYFTLVRPLIVLTYGHLVRLFVFYCACPGITRRF